MLFTGTETSQRHPPECPPVAETRGFAEPGLTPSVLPASDRAAFLADCMVGLSQPQKSLPCKWLYDAAGSRMFEQICAVPEYYPSRTEMQLIVRALPRLAERIDAGTTLIELGSGASRKTRALLDALPGVATYVPIDISASALEGAVRQVRRDYPGLAVRPLCADFSALGDLDLAAIEGPVLAFFPGSTIGNMAPEQAIRFLGDLRQALPRGAALLLGIDVIKDPNVLIAAYDDAAGVTAAFNRNLLVRINRELGGDIDVAAFAHRAVWNAVHGRIEMHLVSARFQRFCIGSHVFLIAPGESIHTENSYKPAVSQSLAIFAEAGWTLADSWTETDPSYLLCLLEPAEIA